jgi:hypothetical protein
MEPLFTKRRKAWGRSKLEREKSGFFWMCNI